MPIYAYRCAECGHAVDVLQKVSDAPLAECPSCHRPALVKQVTAAGFQLKGSGWYATDFRDKKGGSGAAKDKPAEAAADGKPAEAAAKPAEGAKPADSASPTPAAPAPAPTPPPASSSGS
jgi:putative FmdB family regulatory protein